MTLPSANLPTRILGPCRSAMMATSRPARWAASRTMVARSMWSCALPWLKFRRTTLTPSRTICSSSCGSLEAGPRVATILVARRTCMECLSLRVCNRVSILTRMRLHEGNIPACGQEKSFAFLIDGEGRLLAYAKPELALKPASAIAPELDAALIKRLAEQGGRADLVLDGEPQMLYAAKVEGTPWTLAVVIDRSEEHTSELQSPCNLVCRLLLEKKKK